LDPIAKKYFKLAFLSHRSEFGLKYFERRKIKARQNRMEILLEKGAGNHGPDHFLKAKSVYHPGRQ